MVGCYTSLSLALVGVKAKQSNSLTSNTTNSNNTKPIGTVSQIQIPSPVPTTTVSPSSVNIPPQQQQQASHINSPLKQSQIPTTLSQQKMDKFIQSNLSATANNNQPQCPLLPTPSSLPSN